MPSSATEMFAGISIRRIRGFTLGLSVVVAALAAWRFGTGSAASFTVGALASYFNFQLLHAAVGRLGAEPSPGSRRIVLLFVFRYFALGLIGYATVKVFGVNPVSFCVGLLVTTFALLLDSLSELIYARA
ncbi:MAG: ATP synthase subunit I [Bryobacterales bacterium]|nr:ATP synthase subunit I [Bryobacterales bacterium]